MTRRGGGRAGAAGGLFGRVAGRAFRFGGGRRGRGGGPPGGTPRRTPEPARSGDPRASARSPESRTTTRDPIDVITGEVLLVQTDVELAGVLPLVVRRTHVSGHRDGSLFGPFWASTLDQHLRPTPDGVALHSAEATVQHYDGATLPGIAFLPGEGRQWTLMLTPDGYTVTDPQEGLTFHFPEPGDEHGWSRLPLTAVTDRNGNRLDLVRRAGVLVELRHSGGYVVDVTTETDPAGEPRVVALALRDGEGDGAVPLVRYGYGVGGTLTEVVNSSGRALTLDYADGKLTGWTDRNGHWYRYEYDDRDRAFRAAGSDGMLDVELRFDPDARTTAVTDSLGATTTYRYDERLQIVAETDPLGGVQRFAWDRFDRLLTHTDALGATTGYGYDDRGNLTSLTRPDGGRFTITRNDLNLPTEIVEPQGTVWRRAYDGRGNLVASTDPLGAVTAFTYDERGRPTSRTEPSGARTVFDPDGAGLPRAVTDPLGALTRYRRDAAGRTVETVDPVGGTVRQGWTAEGLPVWRTGPDGGTERWTYDPEGNLTEYVDASGGRSAYEWGPFGTVRAETGADGVRRVFDHDTELRLTAVHGGAGNVWAYEYDAAGNLLGENDFDGRRVRYGYDAGGRLVSRVNGAGETARFVRDVLGNVVGRTAPEGTTEYGYDRAGMLVRAAGQGVDLVLDRDPLGRITAERRGGHVLASEFDADGNRVRRRTPSGAASTWTYDATGRAVGVAAGERALGFAYDGAGREVRRRIGATAILDQEWDPAHRLTSQALWGAPGAGGGDARLLQHRAYRYRADGSTTGTVDRLTGERRFDLDAMGRVTAVRAHGWSERYAYDAVGNLAATALAPDAGGDETVPPSFGDREQEGARLRRAGRVGLDHDAQGRVVARRERTLSGGVREWRFAWDSDDRLTWVRTPDGALWRYTYDPLGRRVAKERLAADGATVEESTEYHWDGPLLAEQVHRSGATTWDYEPGTFRPVYQRHRRVDEASREWVDEQFYGIVTDALGAPKEMVDPDHGTVAWNSGYGTLWGERLGAAGAGVDCPLRFPGQYADPETGLNYNYNRYYSPAEARYLSPDPLGLTPQPDPYAYVFNPTGWTDPLGLNPGSDRGQSGHPYARSVLPGAGRQDGQKVFAGHGEHRRGAGETTVPPGTRVAVYAEHGQKIHDRVGLGVERGTGRTPVRVYEAGESMPNYTLKAPKGLTIAENSRTVEDAANLSDLLKPRMGTVHWAACQELRR